MPGPPIFGAEEEDLESARKKRMPTLGRRKEKVPYSPREKFVIGPTSSEHSTSSGSSSLKKRKKGRRIKREKIEGEGKETGLIRPLEKGGGGTSPFRILRVGGTRKRYRDSPIFEKRESLQSE